MSWKVIYLNGQPGVIQTAGCWSMANEVSPLNLRGSPMLSALLCIGVSRQNLAVRADSLWTVYIFS